MRKSTKKTNTYNPNLGFIGNSEVKVSNYIFSQKRLRKAYEHSEPVAKRILDQEVKTHFKESRKLTKFLKNRDLTFSKKTNKGYKTFVVPCTTTVVPLQKSLFNEVETASQKLVISLRKVLQDIYSAKSIKDSKFVKSLPSDVRKIFINAVETSACYFPQLHHPNMKAYPFMDNIGLDLVLVEDYLQKSSGFPKLIARRKESEIPSLPFRILEINAGSPSGASNNMNMLEGIYNQNPEILDQLGNIMPNDHFKVLGETYKSLGDNWTGIKDGIQVLLPPGGQNGAAPEIHQLAAYSGLVYADSNQLYRDSKGHIRLRTVGKENPIVTAIYSRINADSALFDEKKNLLMRDPDSGENIYLRDHLDYDKREKKGKLVTDKEGKPVPLQSDYAIPGLINAILEKKIYMGGLNRIIDNKIILATLTHYAPKFFAKDILSKGLKLTGTKLLPPQTLPPTKESVKIIKANPEEWVIKAPELAGGQGVYILKTMSQPARKEIIAEIEKNPQDYAYQQLVRIARIPVAVKRKDNEYRFANLAADIRMWVFFGGGKDELPRLTHNALVRYAPQEKGKMSSIVNTSAGGGYAPFVIIDDTKSKESLSAKDVTTPLSVKRNFPHIPVFVGAQLVQVARMIQKIKSELDSESTLNLSIHSLFLEMKSQLREITSALHPRLMEPIYRCIDSLELDLDKEVIGNFYSEVNRILLNIAHLVEQLESLELKRNIVDTIENISVLNRDEIEKNYSLNRKALDITLADNLKLDISLLEESNDKEIALKICRQIKRATSLNLEVKEISSRKRKTILSEIEIFTKGASSELKKFNNSDFSDLFDSSKELSNLSFETLYLGKRDSDREIMVASQLERRENKLLDEIVEIDSYLKDTREKWLAIEAKSLTLNALDKATYITEKRTELLASSPKLRRLQALSCKTNPTVDELIELLDIVPYAKFNIESFAKSQGISVRDIFVANKLENNRIALLDDRSLEKLNLSTRSFAGECFAKKKSAHGLYSNSNIYIWVRSSLDAFTMLYTIGHELIHYQQLKSSMNAEKRALKDGALSSAICINYYGNFLGMNDRTVESISSKLKADRTTLYGYSDLIATNYNSELIKSLRLSRSKSNNEWDKCLNKYGSLLGLVMPNATGTRVKALQEVLPALENAKNILFAKSLGLVINRDPISATLPTANEDQVEMYKLEVLSAATSPIPCWENLRVIANHQLYGVSFKRAEKDDLDLSLSPSPITIAVGQNYNQTQQ